MNKAPIHLSGLNGLRAIAAISVVIGHVFQDTFGNWGISGLHLPIFKGGVTLFFVISGFLITYLLLQEKKKINDVKIGAFYMRRILRIWPIYYLYILVCIAVLAFMGLSDTILTEKLWWYLFFAANIPFLSATGIPMIVHFWSIGVEEQFYLFWPWLAKFSKRYLIPIICVVGIVWFSMKLGSWVAFTNKSLIYKFFNVTKFHCMMLGALGAVLYDKKNKYYIKIFSNKIGQIIVWLLFLLSGVWGDYVPAIIREEVIAVMSLFLITGQACSSSFINLENKACDYVGKISYGIYVIHPLLIFVSSYAYRMLEITLPTWLQAIGIYTYVILATILVANLSYHYVEKPFLKLKNRFAIVKSQNSIKK